MKQHIQNTNPIPNSNRVIQSALNSPLTRGHLDVNHGRAHDARKGCGEGDVGPRGAGGAPCGHTPRPRCTIIGIVVWVVGEWRLGLSARASVWPGVLPAVLAQASVTAAASAAAVLAATAATAASVADALVRALDAAAAAALPAVDGGGHGVGERTQGGPGRVQQQPQRVVAAGSARGAATKPDLGRACTYKQRRRAATLAG